MLSFKGKEVISGDHQPALQCIEVLFPDDPGQRLRHTKNSQKQTGQETAGGVVPRGSEVITGEYIESEVPDDIDDDLFKQKNNANTVFNCNTAIWRMLDGLDVDAQRIFCQMRTQFYTSHKYIVPI